MLRCCPCVALAVMLVGLPTAQAADTTLTLTLACRGKPFRIRKICDGHHHIRKICDGHHRQRLNKLLWLQGDVEA
jgi:hypothetical protein